MYGFMRRQLDRGHQAYVVCPVIEETENEELKAAEVFAEELQSRYFRDTGWRYCTAGSRLARRTR